MNDEQRNDANLSAKKTKSTKKATNNEKKSKTKVKPNKKAKDRKFTKVPKEFSNDKKILIMAVRNNGMDLRYASDELKNNKEVVLEAVKNNGNALQYASDELKNDKEVVMEAIKNNKEAFLYASLQLKKDKEIIDLTFEKDNTAIVANTEVKKDGNTMVVNNKSDTVSANDANTMVVNNKSDTVSVNDGNTEVKNNNKMADALKNSKAKDKARDHKKQVKSNKLSKENKEIYDAIIKSSLFNDLVKYFGYEQIKQLSEIYAKNVKKIMDEKSSDEYTIDDVKLLAINQKLNKLLEMPEKKFGHVHNLKMAENFIKLNILYNGPLYNMGVTMNIDATTKSNKNPVYMSGVNKELYKRISKKNVVKDLVNSWSYNTVKSLIEEYREAVKELNNRGGELTADEVRTIVLSKQLDKLENIPEKKFGYIEDKETAKALIENAIRSELSLEEQLVIAQEEERKLSENNNTLNNIKLHNEAGLKVDNLKNKIKKMNGSNKK